jgi:hypothetical protein
MMSVTCRLRCEFRGYASGTAKVQSRDFICGRNITRMWRMLRPYLPRRQYHMRGISLFLCIVAHKIHSTIYLHDKLHHMDSTPDFSLAVTQTNGSLYYSIICQMADYEEASCRTGHRMSRPKPPKGRPSRSQSLSPAASSKLVSRSTNSESVVWCSSIRRFHELE